MQEIHLTGNFPRPEPLIEMTRQFDRGRTSEIEVQRHLDHSVNELLELQISNKLDMLVDGQLNWQDLFRPFTELLAGINPGTLTRWFDNNTFYRRPIVVDRVKRAELPPTKYYRHDLIPEGRGKAIMPGPYTFAKLSENAAYSSFADLVDDLAHSLANISKELTSSGYRFLQLNEPSLCTATIEELEIAMRAYDILAKSSPRIMLQTYFSSISHIKDKLVDFPVDCIGVDLYANDLSIFETGSVTTDISCGCIDGRNSLVEPVDQTVELVTKMIDAVAPHQVYVGPNCDLEFLPYVVAAKKVQLLGAVRRSLNRE